MRAGQIIICDKHELLLVRITESICYENGIKTVIQRNKATPSMLYYICYGKIGRFLKMKWFKKVYLAINEERIKEDLQI